MPGLYLDDYSRLCRYTGTATQFPVIHESLTFWLRSVNSGEGARFEEEETGRYGDLETGIEGQGNAECRMTGGDQYMGAKRVSRLADGADVIGTFSHCQAL